MLKTIAKSTVTCALYLTLISAGFAAGDGGKKVFASNYRDFGDGDRSAVIVLYDEPCKNKGEHKGPSWREFGIQIGFASGSSAMEAKGCWSSSSSNQYVMCTMNDKWERLILTNEGCAQMPASLFRRASR